MNYPTCQFCRFAGTAEGLGAGRRVCARSAAATGAYRIVACAETCDDWRLHANHTFDPADLARPGTRLIPLTQGEFAIVDSGDYDKPAKYKWRILDGPNTSYAVTWHEGKHIFMHRLITGAPKGLVVDHNGLNNTRKNLRVCTVKQNLYNRKARKGGTSKYKGVSWHTVAGKFCAMISHEGKRYYLGLFTDEKEAARAYDKKANELFGEFAWLNFPDEHAEGVTSAAGSRGRSCLDPHRVVSRRKRIVY